MCFADSSDEVIDEDAATRPASLPSSMISELVSVNTRLNAKSNCLNTRETCLTKRFGWSREKSRLEEIPGQGLSEWTVVSHSLRCHHSSGLL